MLLVKSISGIFLLSFHFVKCTLSNSHSLEHSFRECLITSSVSSSSVGQCLGTGLLSRLQVLDNEPEFDLVDGLTLVKDSSEYREGFSFADTDPSNFRSIVDSFGKILTRRQNLRWDMGTIYPGLTMHIAPSPGTAGILEFQLDPHKEALTRHSLKEASTGKLMARQFLLPLLLGVKFNVITIVPIIFGILALIAKKAVILSKFALILSSAFGLGTLLLGNNRFPQNYHGGGIPFGGPPYGANYGPHHFNRYPEDYPDLSYKENNMNAEIYRTNDVAHSGRNLVDKNSSPNDELRLTENLQAVFSNEAKNDGRNFAWNENERSKNK